MTRGGAAGLSIAVGVGFRTGRAPSSRVFSRLGPDLHFAFEMNLVLLENPFPNDLDQLEHIVCLCSRVGDDEIGVLLADFSPADLEALQAGLIDERARAEPARI